ncbi:hypothetical protein GPJ56_011108 [Histomonas meleagridis]|nr:hypothetical protein GPJ56_011108 [Histomonas meleagridis]
MSSGQILHDTAPWPLFVLALASFLQSILLIRYLQLRPATLVVVRMISSAIVTYCYNLLLDVCHFSLVFVIFGVSWFGWYSPLMSSSRQVAKLLVAASYGDYLLDGYDGLTDGSDKPKIIPSAYLTVWIFNGLGIWFYIVLAILHAALFKEVHIARDEMIEEGEVNEEDMDAEDPLPWLQYVADR